MTFLCVNYEVLWMHEYNCTHSVEYILNRAPEGSEYKLWVEKTIPFMIPFVFPPPSQKSEITSGETNLLLSLSLMWGGRECIFDLNFVKCPVRSDFALAIAQLK